MLKSLRRWYRRPIASRQGQLMITLWADGSATCETDRLTEDTRPAGLSGRLDFTARKLALLVA